MFDEASVTEWKGRDLRLANQIPDIDVLVIAVQKVNNRCQRTFRYIGIEGFCFTRKQYVDASYTVWSGGAIKVAQIFLKLPKNCFSDNFKNTPKSC